MKTIAVKLTRGGDTIGWVRFKLRYPKSARGELVAVNIPKDKRLETNLRRHLQENPDAIPVFGGTAPKDIGSYGDGVLAVLDRLSQTRNFDFDRSVIPLPTFPAGAVG